jgi:hypothetical protein
MICGYVVLTNELGNHDPKEQIQSLNERRLKYFCCSALAAAWVKVEIGHGLRPNY